MATINSSQAYDIIHTLTYASSGGTNEIRLHRGSSSSHDDTVYYRAGTSGAWTSLSVSGSFTTFPITSTTMQIAHNWNKSGDSYMTPGFRDGTMTGIAISQKAVLSGVVGNYFMYRYTEGSSKLTTLDIPNTSGLTSVGNSFMERYADGCTNLTTLAVPNTSGLTSVGNSFMERYAEDCDSLTTLAVPNTSGLTSVDRYFMYRYARGCSSLTTLAVPDTSGLTSVSSNFMVDYANGCSSLTKLILPKAGWFKTNNVNWGVPSGRLGLLHGDTTNSVNQADWQALTVSGKTLYTNYIRSASRVWLNGTPPPNSPPTTTLTSPANNVILTTTTPTLAFTATDADDDQVSYQIQVSTSSSFTTTHMDVTTATFASGTQQTRVVSPALTEGGIPYYWRVRAKDPSGSNSYGAWSATRTMTVENNVRYLRASGNWNGSVWAFTPSDAAGSAPTPTSADNVIINSNYTVTLNQNISIGTLSVIDGTFNASSYNVTVTNLLNVGVLGPAGGNLNMGSGTWTINAGEYHASGILIYNTSSFNASNATIIFNVTGSSVDFYPANNTFRDVIINIGNSSNESHSLDIGDTPTFRSLIIQSKNSAAHTVNFDDGAIINVNKLVAIGSSSSNRLALNSDSSAVLAVHDDGSSYGQFVNMNISSDVTGYTPMYIGSNSVQTSGYYWLLQDPPKISTLVDPLTTTPGSNPNWNVTGTVTQIHTGREGGGYELGWGSTFVSSDTYDLTNSQLIIERPDNDWYEGQFGVAEGEAGDDYLIFTETVTWDEDDGSESIFVGGSGVKAFQYPISSSRFIKLEVSGSTFNGSYSIDGNSWTHVISRSLSEIELLRLKSTRIGALRGSGAQAVGSINPNFNASPTTTLNSPIDNTALTTTTPTLAFTATDPEGEAVSYQIQVGNQSFSTIHMDTTTGTFPSGQQRTQVVSPALTQGGIDYYWRVRAKDPSGSDSYGAWATARKMTTEALPPSVTSGATSSVTTTTATAAGNVTSANGATITERGIVYSTSTNPTTANSKQVVSGTTGSFSGNLTGLTPNTTYYWRAYATNSKGTTYGVNRSFTTEPRPPAVSTGTPSGTTINSITVTGSSLTSNPDSQTITERGVVYSTSQNPTIANSSKIGAGDPFNVSITGLDENTTYYIRAYVKWRGSDHAYGSQVSFKTQGRPVTTLISPSANGTVSDIRPNLEFSASDQDNDSVTYQLQVNTTNSFTSPVLDVLSEVNTGFTNRSDIKTDPFYSGNTIRYTAQADQPRGSDFWWRVRAKDVTGSDTWGNWTTARKFSISTVPATVTTTGVSDILDTSIKISGSITDNGGATVTERGAVLSLTPNPTTSDLKFTATGDNFTAQATGLTASTTYYVRTYAINAAGTSYSTESTIMTLQPLAPPTVTVGDPTRLIDVSTQITAEVTLDGLRDVTERGIVFSTDPNPDTDDNKVTASTAGLGSYTLLLTGLLPETTYYYRAYAINDQGTGYSAEKSFTTLPPFVPDEGDGYWVFSVSGSDAIVSRSQATPTHSSVSLPLADLGLEDGKTYTLAVGDFVSELGDPKVSLLYYDAANPVTTNVPENSQLTFTYDLDSYHTYILQLHVTGDDPVAEELTATFKDLYLAEESTFSDFVPFTPYGLFEIKLENNQIVDKRRQDVINSMFERVQGWGITPFEVKTEGLGYFEIGDGITIKDDKDRLVKSYITESRLTLDGGIQETLIGIRPPETETDYSKAGNIKKLISNTTLQVDKQRQEIEALVQDVYDNDGYIEEKFSQVFQDINQVRTTVQGAGGVNLIRNSVMYAYNNLGYPENWTTTHVDGEGTTIVIQGSAESKAAGGLSGNTFILNGVKVNQTVTVRKDADFIPDDQKTYYTFNVKVKKNLVGEAYIKLSNRQEEHLIELPNGEEYLWEDVKIEALLPLDDHYEIEIYSDSDAAAQFTDAMLSVGEYTHSWTQAPGEIGNASVSITEEGLTIRQDQFRYNYTHLDALGLNVHKRIRGQQEEVFGFNADETHMSKIKADKQMSMGKVRVVPIEMNGTSGWAWTGTEE